MFGFLKTNHEARRDEVQAEFVARVAAAAQEFVQAAGPDGVGLDYTPGSIHALDAALEAAHVGALALTPMQTVGAAAYLYEVARRARRVVRSLRRRGPGGAGLRRVRRPGLPGRHRQGRAAHPLRAGRGHPALLRTFHRGPACRRALTLR